MGRFICGILTTKMIIVTCFLFVSWMLILPVIKCQDDVGLFPNILNLATRSTISVNATCGEEKSEVFCKLVDHVKIFPYRNSHCDICDARSQDERRRHPITNAINGRNSWWQSPTLTNGALHNYVTITLDLKQVYQVAYVIVKAANSPRPGNWILERSIDGITYQPWQYFGIRNRDCKKKYGIKASRRIPTYLRDDEVICTTKYSKIYPLENGEIFISLINGRPGVKKPSPTLLEFTSARYVRLRLQRIRTLNADLMTFRSTSDLKFIDPFVTRRYFYSIKDISIGGQCICYGHASSCKPRPNTDRLYCECKHNTCGNNCEKCCEFYYQKPWQPGNNGLKCEKCNCHGHSMECVYNATVDAMSLSLNSAGEYDGGGVCIDCKDYTAGINCEQCIDGYYRPLGETPYSRFPCRPCRCDVTLGSTGKCVLDDSMMSEGKRPGDCICKETYGGPTCQECAFGYYGYPYCKPCPCNGAGTVNSQQCSGNCVCKANVEGFKCDRCKRGFFNLHKDNPVGCMPCFCFGVSSVCQSANLGLIKIPGGVGDMSDGMSGWSVTSVSINGFTYFIQKNLEGWLVYRAYPANQNSLNPTENVVVYYWQAPLKYLGNRLTSYGGNLRYTVKYETDRTVPYQRHIYGVDVIIQSGNMTIVNGKSYLRENVQEERTVTLNETSWFQLVKNDRYETLQPITKKKFMIFLFNIERLLIRATYHSAQNTVYLRDVTMDAVSALSNSSATLKTVEKCSCPRGYQGLSCEECESGYRRVGNKLYGGMCLPCNCNNHAERCDINTGKCNNCLHFTTGENCDQCLPGYYGDPRRGTEDDCKPCACPLLETTNQFSPTCQLIPRVGNYDNYRCDKCAVGYVGDRCERCDTGYYGDPTKVDGMCRPCSCGGNIDTGNPQSCDRVTGECLRCLNNTEGPNCQRCVEGYYGTAYNGDCKACNCDLNGSVNSSCDQYSGRCICKDRFYGRRCDQCQPGYGNVEELCVPCDCDPQGSRGSVCESFSGQCFCNVGVTGRRCDKCLPGYYGFSFRGCEDCRCNDHGTNQTDTCDDVTGVCNCLPNVTGSRCNTCKENFWGLATGNGCSPCECDRLGSVYLQCDQRTGQCTCKTGVDGQHCNQCRKGYYGFSISGCKRCQPCDKPGHVCDSITGQCVCPPLTTGPLCDKCQPNTWGYDSITGCKPCNCDLRTSESRQCDLITGQCTCKADYTGNRCEKCLPGFYNHPNCQLCLCSADGTDSSNCDNSTGICQCDNRGQCPCKVNVETRTCTRCRAGSFSLHKTNPYGCTECFCFERSSRCEQVPYIWKKVTIPDRSVSFDPRVTDKVSLKYKSYVIIPHNSTWAAIPKFLASKPIYWSLPDSYLGDLTLSYNGKMRLEVQYKLDSGSSARADSSPDIVVVGNNFQMTYRTVIPWSLSGERSIVVKFHPTGWKVVGFGDATRSFMMIVLQNVTDIYIKAAPDDSTRFTMLTSVSLDSAQPGNGSTDNPALGVEICQCPEQYSGLSCQDPADGYYRLRHNLTADLSQPIRVIGHVVPCDCHRHSDICDRETGVCKNCQHNTTGVHCEKCRPGFYGDATRGSSGDCQPCICPTIENNFSSSCEIRRGQLICTNCTEGYIGIRCESCAEGYYGNPRQPSGKCQPCKCNPQGSVSTICNARGQCQCLPGITGDKCDGCQPRYAVEDGQCVSCDEGCTADLMSELDDLRNMTLQVNLTGKLPVPWNELWKIKNETDLLKDELETIRNAELGHLKNQTRDIEKEAQDLLTRSRRAKLKAGPLEEKAVTLKKNATDLEVDLNNTVKDMKEFVEKLVDIVQSLFHNKSGINVTDALEKVRAILKDIKDRDFSKNLQRTLDENKLSEKLSETILDMRNTLVNTSGVMEEIQAIMEKLMDLQKHSNESQSQSDEVLNMINNIVRKQNQTEDLLVDVDLVHDNTVKILGDGHQFNIESAGELNQAKDNIKDIERKASIFDQILPELRKKVNSRSQITEAEAKVRAAESHARGLSDYAEKLEREFEKTKADAADPLKAAQVYSNIVKAVNEAEEAAKRAIKAAEDSIQIAGVKNITDEVSRSLNRSRELLKQASKTLSKVPGLDKHLNTLNEDLLRVEKEQGIIKQGHADIKEALDQLPKDLGDRTVKVSNNVDKTADDLETLEETVGNVDSNIKNDLIPKFNRIQDVSFDGIFESIENSIDTAAKNVKKIGDIVEGVESAANRSMTAESRLNDKLKMLRDNIKQARAQAEKVKVSLSASGQCVRSYHSKSVPGVTNKISFSFKTNNTTTNQIILLLQRSPTEFLALEMINAKIQFSWNVGAGVGSVTSDLPIQNEANFIRTIDKWYHVKADRLGRIGTLLVSKLSDLNETKKVTGVSPVGRSFLKLDENSELYVSGVPFGINRSKELSSSANFSGCMNEMYIDDKKIGLHNFKTSTEQGCWGCRNVPTATAEQTGTFHFDGFGYSAKPQIRSYRSTEFFIKMEFKTFWRDAILLFTGNNKTGDFLYVGLQDQKVVLQIYTGGRSYLSLSSNFAYNNNKWHTVVSERQDLTAYLQVDGTDMKYLTAPGSNTGLEMKGRPLYFGGIPESYDLQPFLKWGNINRTGFLGCLRQVQLQTFAQDLLTGETVGVTNGCPDEGYRTIGFYGNGFAKYTAASMLLDTADVSLSFRTTQKDALLLLAYDNDQRNFYSIVLSNGKVEGRFSTNSLPKKITTSKLFNDGQLHNVAIQKVGNRITVYVDDEEQLEEVTLQRKEVSVDHLYIGGVINLNFPQGQAMAANTQGLEGCVSDVIINQKILNLNTPLQFERADIGRCRLPTNGVPVGLEDAQTSKKKTTTTTTTSTTPTTTKVPTSAATTSIAPNSCAQTPDLQQNIFSLIFGNSEKSHGKIVIDPAEVQESFEISFDFRTFYDDGAVFLLTNKNNTKYVAAQIRDGSVSVYWTNNGGKAKKFISSKVVTNGQWHTAIISKDRRRISLVVDGKLEMDKRKITKKLSVISPLIVGSIMDISISNNDMVKHSLRGCMKNFKVNAKSIMIADATEVQGVTTCYINMEPGVFMDKNSYGVIASNYAVGREMKIELEFRTHKPNGVILSIADNQAVTLELHQGKLKFSVFNVALFTAESKSSESICNDQWHSLEATLIGNVVKLVLDGGPPQYGSSQDTARNVTTSSALFVGGVPDYAVKQIASFNQKDGTAEGFEGCLRNFKIDSTPVDWFSLVEQENVQRTGCPY